MQLRFSSELKSINRLIEYGYSHNYWRYPTICLWWGSTVPIL